MRKTQYVIICPHLVSKLVLHQKKKYNVLLQEWNNVPLDSKGKMLLTDNTKYSTFSKKEAEHIVSCFSPNDMSYIVKLCGVQCYGDYEEQSINGTRR